MMCSLNDFEHVQNCYTQGQSWDPSHIGNIHLYTKKNKLKISIETI